MAKLVFGLGTGGCGTHSLSVLLCAQHRVRIKHEETITHWTPFITNEGPTIINDFKLLLLSMHDNKKYDIMGDVSFPLLPHVDLIMALYPDSKFICLKRDKEKTVRSLIEHMGPRGNVYTDHDGIEYKNNKADHSSPNIPRRLTTDREEAASLYYDLYYDTINDYIKYYGDALKIFNPEIMWTQEGQEEILSFAGINKERMVFLPKEACTKWSTADRKKKAEERAEIRRRLKETS